MPRLDRLQLLGHGTREFRETLRRRVRVAVHGRPRVGFREAEIGRRIDDHDLGTGGGV